MSAALLFKFVTNAFVQRLVVSGLEELAKRTDNTVDDQVITVVKKGLANRPSPTRGVPGVDE